MYELRFMLDEPLNNHNPYKRQSVLINRTRVGSPSNEEPKTIKTAGKKARQAEAKKNHY
jgi:hypothetical protein